MAPPVATTFLPRGRPGTLLGAEEADDAALRGPSAGDRAADLARTLMPFAVRGLAAAALLAAAITGTVKGYHYWQTRAAQARVGTAVLESVPPGSQILVDGQAAGLTPLRTTLAAGPHTIEFRDRDATRTMQLVVPGGGLVEQRLDWAQKPTGSLRVETTPDGARVIVDGQDRGVTPLTIDGVVAGTHTVVMQSRQGTIQRTVTVTQGTTTAVSESIFAGWVKVFSPFEVTASEGGHALRLDDTSQVMLPAGRHELRFENQRLGFEDTETVDVQPGGQATISLLPAPSSLSVTASEPAQVWIDGTPVGQTPLQNQAVPLGTHNVMVRSASGQQRQFVVTVTVQPVSLNVDFSAPASPPGL
ncbi:MAG: PEGA domain-containing protein [Acidobacteriota bacterium]|nr:PEGA domain-containing protein [Acidobacteriota bacterium]